MDQEDRPIRHGQKQDLTDWCDAIDSLHTENGITTYRVHGRLVRVSECDFAASDHFGEEVLRWTLCVEAKAKNSHDTAVQPIKRNNVKDFKKRFEAAFKEYEANYGNHGLPLPAVASDMDLPANLIGKYVPPVPLPRAKADIEARKAVLLRELSALENDEKLEESAKEPAEEVETFSVTSPIAKYNKIPAKAREKLVRAGVLTVGQLAALADGDIADLGAGQWQKWRTEADNSINGPLSLRDAA